MGQKCKRLIGEGAPESGKSRQSVLLSRPDTFEETSGGRGADAAVSGKFQPGRRGDSEPSGLLKDSCILL